MIYLEEQFLIYIPELNNTLFNVLCTGYRPKYITDYGYKCQDQLICLKEYIGANNNYNEMDLGQFWISVINSYHGLILLLMKYFLFYLYERAFSDMLTLQNKKRNRLNVEHDLILCISDIEPYISHLIYNYIY